MKKLIEYIKEALILEGGTSVNGAEPIRGDLAKPVADEIISKLKDKFNCKCATLGSVGKKTKDQTSGDIDIAIEMSWEDHEKVLNFIKSEYPDAPMGNVVPSLQVFNFGYTYDDNGKNKIVQVDFMFVPDVEFAEFAYHSPDFNKNESKYKGMYASTLMMAIVANTPIDKKPILYTKDDYDGSYEGQKKEWWQYNLNQGKGLQILHKTTEGKSKPVGAKTIDREVVTTNVDKIVKTCLGDEATKEITYTFENLLGFITSDKYPYRSVEQLEKIKDHFMTNQQAKGKTSEELWNEFGKMFDEAIKLCK